MKKASFKKYDWANIYKKILKNIEGIKYYDIDIRYLNKYILNHPELFPQCMIENNFTAVFITESYKWEIWEGKHIIKVNKQSL